jgi:hypothetical protein
VIVSVSFVGTGLFIALFGVLIKYGGYHELIAGFDADRVEDPEALGDFVGRNLLFIATTTIVTGIVGPLLSVEDSLWYWMGYVAVVCVVTAWIVYRSQRFVVSD